MGFQDRRSTIWARASPACACGRSCARSTSRSTCISYRAIDHDPIKLQFLKSIQHIAESCGTHVIAEGMETEAELRVVKDIGIALGQGYFIARPSPRRRCWPPPRPAALSTRPISPYFQDESTLRSQTTAHKLPTYVEPVLPETLNDHVFERFNANPALRIIPVVKSGKPLGLINRYQFIDRFAKPYQRELMGRNLATA